MQKKTEKKKKKNTLIGNWNYCKTKENLSDLITGKKIIDLNNLKLWW